MARKTKLKQSSSLGPFYLMAVGILIVTGVLIWQAINAKPAATAASSPFGGQPFPNVERITVSDALTAFENKEAVFVDVRDSASYQSGHIPDSLNIYLLDFEVRYPELSKNESIILYCT